MKQQKNFIESKDNVYYQKKSVTACVASLELIRDLTLSQEKILKVNVLKKEKSEAEKKAKNLDDLAIINLNPDDSKLRFIPLKDGLVHTLYVSIQEIGEENNKHCEAQLVEEITKFEIQSNKEPSGGDIKTILSFNLNDIDREVELNQPHWEKSPYFTKVVRETLERYIPATFGDQARINFEDIEYKEPPKMSNKQRKILKKHIGKIDMAQFVPKGLKR